MYVYLPGCNFTRACPEASAWIWARKAQKAGPGRACRN